MRSAPVSYLSPFSAVAALGVAPPMPSPLRLADLLGGLGPAPVPAATGPSNWKGVWERFETFNRNILLTPAQQQDGRTKFASVVERLNAHYYGAPSLLNAFYFGSWGKRTATRPPRDVDLYFRLPAAVFDRFENRAGNRQSALLQEVREVLRMPFPRTDVRGDRQVVVVPFDSYKVEIVPAFLLPDGRYVICDAHDGGRYKVEDPIAELQHLEAEDVACNGYLRPLIRMIKTWQAFRDVPIKSFQLELVAVNFMQQSPWRGNGWFWFDWYLRDFFAYLIAQANSCVTVPGTGELIWLGDAWKSRALTAYSYALEACLHEYDNFVYLAGGQWREIFGPDIPEGFPV